MEKMLGYKVRREDMRSLALRDIEAIGQLLESEEELVRV